MSWAPVPGRKKGQRIPKRDLDFAVTTKAVLKGKTKGDLVDEVYRLQTLVREVAVELGITKRSKHGELVIKPHFISHIINAVRAGWSYNL